MFAAGRCWRLRKVGFTVRTADNSIDTLIMAHGDPPHLIVVNHVVGWLDVRDLLTRLRRDVRTAGIPILLIMQCANVILARDCQRLNITLLVKSGKKSLAVSTAQTTALVESRKRARKS